MKVSKVIQALLLVMTISFALPMQSNAQAIEFSEYTREFFTNPKSYSISIYAIEGLGRDGATFYKDGEASLKVTSRGFSYRLKNGSEKSFNISSSLKKVTVLTSNGDVSMQMYVLNDGKAARAIRFKDGRLAVYRYVLNNPTGKYVLLDWFDLRN